MAPQPSLDSAAETVRLEVRRAAAIDIGAARAALLDVEWLGPSSSTSGPEVRSVTTELVLPVLDGSSTSPIRKSAIMEIGVPRVIDDGLSVDISWRSATLAPLFPVFAGRLLVTDGEVTLVGRYAPPFGQIGLLIDRGLLHFVAQRTANALIARFVDRFAAATERDPASPRSRPARATST